MDDQARQGEHKLNGALRRVVLLKETGPKSAAWHRARVRTIWRLHRLIAQAPPVDGTTETSQESSQYRPPGDRSGAMP
jgi:hypothetical protein